MEDDQKKWKTNQSTKINLIGCDTIVNSPSGCLFLICIAFNIRIDLSRPFFSVKHCHKMLNVDIRTIGSFVFLIGQCILSIVTYSALDRHSGSVQGYPA